MGGIDGCILLLNELGYIMCNIASQLYWLLSVYLFHCSTCYCAVCFGILCLQVSGLYEYKVHGVMPDLDPEESARVYVDWEYRKIWDTYVIGE